MSLPLKGKTAVVTGSSRGIGAAIAKRLAADGASVVINYVSTADVALVLAEEINKEGKGSAITIQGDMSSVADGVRVIEKSAEHFGGHIDIVVLNAAHMVNGPLEDITEAEFDKHFTVNVKVPLFQVQAAVKYMTSGGRVIFLSSNVTLNTSVGPQVALYAATKGAVEQFNRVLAKELGAKGITVNSVSPGATATPLFLRSHSQEIVERTAAAHPAGRIAQPEDIAPMVAFLSRDEASWINGQNIYINNGSAV
ncbi:NAD(P)-binding protein [Phanerochaete sordida]|uniref:NAD(P)-binding protein n=1 Tax=Phanerochaete sordida TaxID=48140 RepID=A0A9P3G948_9APHY|nr:NAD(P)-binding protein [Phanerochaete sordida]